MQKEEKEEQDTITLPIKDFLFCVMGDDDGIECSQITKTASIVLQNLLKHSAKWKIETHDWDDVPLRLPVLWRYSDWVTERGKYMRTKARNDAARLENDLKYENLRRIKFALMQKHSLDESYAEILAYKLLNNGSMEAIKYFGVEELAKKEEEIKPPQPSKFWREYLK